MLQVALVANCSQEDVQLSTASGEIDYRDDIWAGANLLFERRPPAPQLSLLFQPAEAMPLGKPFEMVQETSSVADLFVDTNVWSAPSPFDCLIADSASASFSLPAHGGVFHSTAQHSRETSPDRTLLRVWVKALSGRRHFIEIDPNSRVGDGLKRIVAELEGLPWEHVRLACAGKLLADFQAIAYYGVKDGDVFFMVPVNL